MVYKIIAFPAVFVGHLNPTLKLFSELIKTGNVELIVYSVDDFKQKIEAIGDEYRDIGKEYTALVNYVKLEDGYAKFLSSFIEFNFFLIENYTMEAIKIIEKGKPSLVMYDSSCAHIKYAFKIINKKYDESLKRGTIPITKPPKFIECSTTFHQLKDVYPNSYFVFTFPHLHPKSHLFPKNVKFIGSCISSDVHINIVKTTNDTTNDRIQELLDSYLSRFKKHV